MAYVNGVDSLLYADGTRFKLPYITRSSNGWVYKPDVMRTDWEIKRGKNKVFSRSNGDTEARDFLEAHLREHLSDRGWEVPVAVGNPNETMSSGGSISYNIGWEDPVFGWIGVSLAVNPSRHRYSDGMAKVTYTIHSHDVADILIFKRVRSWQSSSDRLTTTTMVTPEEEKELVPRLVQQWKADPWNVTTEVMVSPSAKVVGDGQLPMTFDRLNRIREVFADPGESIKQVEYLKNPSSMERYEAGRTGLHVDDNGFYAESMGNIEFFEKDVIRSILRSSFKWEALAELIEALRFCGIQLAVQEEWAYTTGEDGTRGDRVRSVCGLEISIPKQGETHRHVVKIATTNLNPRVEVECGYEDDERLWLERKQRQAVDQMAHLEGALETFEIDLG